MVPSEPEIIGRTLGAEMQVTKQCEMWYFATLTLVYLADLNLLCQNNYLLLLLAIPVNAGMATARQATSAAQHHCGVWLVASYTIQKSHIVTRENTSPPFWSDCSLLVSCGLQLDGSLRNQDFLPQSHQLVTNLLVFMKEGFKTQLLGQVLAPETQNPLCGVTRRGYTMTAHNIPG